MRPMEGLKPTKPLKAAGMRTEPPVSVPMPINAMPASTATAEPLDEPPGARCAPLLRRLRGVPKCGFSPKPE